MWHLPRLYIRHSVQPVRHLLLQYGDEPHGFRTDSEHQRRCHGKAIASETINRKNDYINPVIRIAVASHGMLFLLPRPQCNVFEKNKIDLLIEGYLIYGETLEQGAHRILRQTLPTAPLDYLHFNLMYHFENEATNRLVYLFTLDLKDDSILCNKNFKGGKLWTFRQIGHNLGRNFFSSCLEYEFEHLEAIIYTREKYKES